MNEETERTLGMISDPIDTLNEAVFQIAAILMAFVIGALVLLVSGYSPIDAYFGSTILKLSDKL